jgi:hypothetical protein
MKSEKIMEKSESKTPLGIINPTNADFDFELWSKAVRDQMVATLQKKLEVTDEDEATLIDREFF